MNAFMYCTVVQNGGIQLYPKLKHTDLDALSLRDNALCVPHTEGELLQT